MSSKHYFSFNHGGEQIDKPSTHIKVTSAITIRNHRSRKSKKKRQYNGHKKRAKIRTNNDLQKHYEQKTEDYDVKRCLGHLLSQKEISKFQQHKLNKS